MMDVVETFLIKLIFKKNIKGETKYLSQITKRFPEIVQKLNKTHYIIQNNGMGLFMILKLIDRFHPFIWIYAMNEFMEYQIPKQVKEVYECRKNLTENVIKELMNIKY